MDKYKLTAFIIAVGVIFFLVSLLSKKDVMLNIQGEVDLGPNLLLKDLVGTVKQSAKSITDSEAQMRVNHRPPVWDTVRLDTSHDVCTMSPDDALWIQASHFLKQNMSSPKNIAEAQQFSQDHIPEIKVKVLKPPNFRQFVGFGTSVVFQITEKLKPSMISRYQGGSFYRVEVTGSSYEYVCPVKAQFDGTYTACCYLQPECSTVVVTLKYVNYSPFWDHVPVPFTKKVYHTSYCPPKSMMQDPPPLTHKCSAEELRRNIPLGRWVLPEGENKMTWAVGNCFVDQYINKTYWKSCLAEKRITIFGDSHQVYSMFGIKQIMGVLSKQDPILKDNMFIEPNLHYIYTQYSSDTAKKLTDLSKTLERRKSPPVSDNDVVLFSLGSWPHSFGTIKPYEEKLNILFKTVNQTKQNPKLPNLRLIFWTPPSVPDGIEYVKRMRTGYDVGAMASYVRQKMEILNVENLDMFNPTNIRNNENLCNAHYLCRRPSSGMDNVVGEVGISFLNNLATFICDV